MAKKSIWIWNHYATNMFFDKGGRHYYFAKYLIEAGYDVKIFCASTIHNTTKNLITDNRLFYEEKCDEIPFVFVRTPDYAGNGKKRILNMLAYYRNVKKAAKHFEKPDVIMGSSVHPLACVAAIQMAKKLKCKNVVEIRDLWPESLVAYGELKANSLLAKILYRGEKWIYKKAGKLIFTVEGGKQYIIDKKWDLEHGGPVDLGKIFHINNGVDLRSFRENQKQYFFADKDLDSSDSFKVVYVGSIRPANRVDLIVEAAQCITGPIKFFIYGDGPEKERLIKYVKDKKIENVIFKGRVDRNQVPSVLARSDLNVLNYDAASVWTYGGSQNKLFEYLASGKPVIANVAIGYCLLTKYKCGVAQEIKNPNEYAKGIIKIAGMPHEDYVKMCKNAIKISEQYDYRNLANNWCACID